MKKGIEKHKTTHFNNKAFVIYFKFSRKKIWKKKKQKEKRNLYPFILLAIVFIDENKLMHCKSRQQGNFNKIFLFKSYF